MNEILQSILGVLIGCFATLLASRWYYEKAGNDLKNESKKLKKLNELILQSLEHAGFAKLKRDEKGNITDLLFVFKVSGITSQPSIGKITLTPNDD